MITIGMIKSAGNASNYFLEEGQYYIKGDGAPSIDPEWSGNAADDLNLGKTVYDHRFREILTGNISEEISVGKIKDGKNIHKPGFDLTFSAPKSWSIASWLNGGEKLQALTFEAAERTMKFVEQDCAMARKFVDGKQVAEKTNNLVYAKFHHRLSRDCDPQEHVHCVVANLTKRSDGKWRALASQTPGRPIDEFAEGTLERVLGNQKVYGAIFRNELAYLAQENGYKINITGDGTFFELSGFPEKLLNKFSQRSQKIKEYVEANGLEGYKGQKLAVLKTRSKKSAVEFTSIAEKVENECAKYGIEDIKKETGSLLKKGESPPLFKNIDSISSKYDLLQSAIKNNFSKHSILEIKKKVILKDGEIYKTPEEKKEINKLHAFLTKDSNEKTPISNDITINGKVGFVSSRKIEDIKGVTDFLGTKSKILPCVVASDIKSKQYIKKNYTGKTILRYGLQKDPASACFNNQLGNTTLLVQDSHKISLKEINNIIEVASKYKSKVIFFYDEAKCKFQNKLLKNALTDISVNRIKTNEVIDIKNIHEHKDIVDKYVHMRVNESKNTLITASSKADLLEVEEYINKRLNDKKVPKTQINVFTVKYLKNQNITNIANYSSGDKLSFKEGSIEVGALKNQEWIIADINKKNKSIIIENKISKFTNNLIGSKKEISLEQLKNANYCLLKKETLTVFEGDKLLLSKQSSHGKRGEIVVIDKIKETGVSIRSTKMMFNSFLPKHGSINAEHANTITSSRIGNLKYKIDNLLSYNPNKFTNISDLNKQKDMCNNFELFTNDPKILEQNSNKKNIKAPSLSKDQMML